MEEIKTMQEDAVIEAEGEHISSPEFESSPEPESLKGYRPTPLSPNTISDILNIKNRVTSETPKTEELEEEMRDQVHDYQNTVYIPLPESPRNKGEILEGKRAYFMDIENQDVEYIENELDDGEDTPLLFVDVNLGPDKAERIVVFEGDTADDLAFRFSQRHNLNDIMRAKLTQLLEAEISCLNQD